MEMDIAPAIVWAAGISTLLGLGTTIWNILTGPARHLRAKAVELEGRLGRVYGRVERIEQILNNLPGHGDMHAIQLSMERMHGDLREMRALMDGNGRIMERLESIVTRHENHLLEGGKR